MQYNSSKHFFILLLTLLFTLGLSDKTLAWDFIWNTEGWSPDGALSQSYTNVNGSSIDFDVTVTGDTGSFFNSTPRINSNRLESYPNFSDNTQSVTYTFTFSEPVNIEDFNIWDIDGNGTSWTDALDITALTVNGQIINPDNVIAGAHVTTVNPHSYESDNSGGLGSRTTSGELTFDFSHQLITVLYVVHKVGQSNPSVTHSGALWFDDFKFHKSHYTMKESSAPECTPAFTDISGSGTALNLADNDSSDIALPFPFLFYDDMVSTVAIGSNGGLIMGGGTTLAATNTNIPVATPAPAILPFWDDLNPGPTGGGDVFYQTLGTPPHRRFIIQWDTVPHATNTGSATFQAILHEGTNDIFFAYNDVNFGDTAFNDGASATIGLNYDQNTSDKYSFDLATLNGLTGICYFFPNDYGDAPLDYGEVLHSIPFSRELSLGDATDLPDNELSMNYSSAADGDNTDNNNDENGVTFRSPAGTNDSIFADVDVNNSTGSNVTVCGWLDIPAGGTVDGSFDAGDQICQTTSGGTVTMQWTGLPSDQVYTTFARFRVCSTAAECNTPTSYASNGEVEDYQVVFDFRPTAVTIGRVELKVEHVAELLTALNIDLQSDQELLKLLQVWDPEASESLPQDDHESIVGALRNYLDPDEDSQVAVLYWDTLEERGTIGFYVERKNTDMSWTRVNADMLPGLINAPMGGEYQLADPGVTKGSYQYRLIEQEARGTTRTYGPFTVTLP